MLLFTVILYGVLQSSYVQTRLTNFIAVKLSKKADAKVTVKKLDFSFFDNVILEGVVLIDSKGDSAVVINELWLSIEGISFENQRLLLDEVTMNTAEIKLVKDSLGDVNLDFLLKLSEKEEETDSSSWDFVIDDLIITNSEFSYDNASAVPEDNGIDFDHIYFTELNLSAKNIDYTAGVFNFLLEDFSFKEKCGFELLDLDAKVFINDNTLNVSNVLLKTQKSEIRAFYVDFSYDDFDDFSDFVEKVELDSRFEDAVLHMNDLAVLFPAIKGFSNEFRFSGEIIGKVNDFKTKQFRLWFADSTFCRGDFQFAGLPDLTQTYMHLSVDKFFTVSSDLEKLQLYPFYKRNTLEIPDEVKRLGQLYYKGEIVGFFNDFVAYGKLKTRAGVINSDIAIKQDSVKLNTIIKGRLASDGFDIKKIFRSTLVGKVAFNANVNGNVVGFNQAEAEIKGKISSIEINNYAYKNIKIDGFLSNEKFNGMCNVDDENLKMQFLGKLDVSDTMIPVFDFSASLHDAKLAKLNFTADSLAEMSLNVTAKIYGDNPDNIRGKLKLLNFEYSNKNGGFFQPNVELIIAQEGNKKDLKLFSPALECKLQGDFVFADLLYNANAIIHDYLPSLPHIVKDSTRVPSADFEFNIHVKDINNIIEAIYPSLKISNYTLINGKYSSENKYVHLVSNIPEFTYGDIEMSNLVLYCETRQGKMDVEAKFDYTFLGKDYKEVESKLSFKDDTVEFSTEWSREDTLLHYKEQVLLNAYLENVNGKTRIEGEVLPGEIIIADSSWNIREAGFEYADSKLSVRNVGLYKKDKEGILLNGTISDEFTDTLNVLIDNFRIDNFFSRTKDGIALAGSVKSDFTLQSVLKNPRVSSTLNIHNFTLNDRKIGEVYAQSAWSAEKEAVEMTVEVYKGPNKIVNLSGDVFVKSKELALNLALQKVKLNTYESLFEDLLHDLKGDATGVVEINGTWDRPMFWGDLTLSDGEAVLDYTNTLYEVSGNVALTGDKLEFVNIPVYNGEDKAKLNGYLGITNFPEYNYNITGDADGIKVLDTRRQDNEDYYGSVFADGVIAIAGDRYNTDVNISAKTVKKSTFYIPIYAGADIINETFLKFKDDNNDEYFPVQNDDNGTDVQEQPVTQNVHCNLEVTKDATINIVLDEVAGDVIRANGTGNFNIEYNSDDDLKIYGEYEIEDGDYLFTLQDIINKKFDIEEGSTIMWSGDPYKAEADIKAVYRTKASIYNLMRYAEDDTTYNKRVPVECIINMSNQLLNPDISLSINVPTMPTANDILASMTLEDISMQFVFLLVFNSFYYDPSNDYDSDAESNNSNAFNVTTWELLSNQLSNWLSKINNDINLGVNYRPGDEVSTDEVEVALSTQLLNDRVTVSVNGYTEIGADKLTGEEDDVSNDIVGDVNIEVKLNKNGNLRMKAFSRSESDPLEDDDATTQGLGIFYTKEFDRIGDLFRRKNQEDTTGHKNETLPVDTLLKK